MMGAYIKVPKDRNKAEQIIDLYDATWTLRPDSWEEIPEDKALIIVVHNGPFDAALFVTDREEFTRTVPSRQGDPRPRTFLLMDRTRAEELTHWKPEKDEEEG